MASPKHPDLAICAFCGKTEFEARKFIAGQTGYICDECVILCQDIIDNEFGEISGPLDLALKKPQEIYEHLNKFIVGQDSAKKTLSVAVYNHYKRVIEIEKNASKNSKKLSPSKTDTSLFKSNVLLLGPTGTGKTYLAQTLAKLLDLPFCIVDATVLTEAGYVGEDVENILLKLITAADYDVKKAERGIIYIDEIDKIARKTNASTSITRDVSGEGVQQALLKIIEGTEANVPSHGGRKHPSQEYIKINTSNILFIASGAFDGIEKIIYDRIHKSSVGFGSVLREPDKENEVFSFIEPEDIHNFGLIPEFIGRLPILATVSELTEDELVHILSGVKNSLVEQYTHLFRLDGVELKFEEGSLLEIAKVAQNRGFGARGLRSILEKTLAGAMFEVPSIPGIEKVIVTKKSILGDEKPKYIIKPNK